MLYGRGGQLFLSKGHIEPFKVPGGPYSSQKDNYKAKKLLFAGRTWPAGRMLSPPALWRHSKNT